MSDAIRSAFESALAQIPTPAPSVEVARRIGLRKRRIRRAASAVALVGCATLGFIVVSRVTVPDAGAPVPPSSSLPHQPPYPEVKGWPDVTFDDPRGPYFEPDYGEGPRHVVTFGTVSYEEESERWSFTVFEKTRGGRSANGEATPSNPSSPSAGSGGTVCGELAMLDEDDDGSGGEDCGLEKLMSGPDQSTHLVISGGGFTIGHPLVSHAGAVSTSVARVDIEFPSGKSHQLPIFEGPPEYGINAYVLFLARITEPGLIIARDEQGNELGRELVCASPAGRTDEEPLTDGPTVTYRGVHWKVADYCRRAISLDELMGQ